MRKTVALLAFGTALMFPVPGKADQPVVIGQEIHIDGQPSATTADSAPSTASAAAAAASRSSSAGSGPPTDA